MPFPGYAVLIGPNYQGNPHVSPLAAPAEDVTAIGAFLADPQRGGYSADCVRIVAGTAATRARVHEELHRMARHVTAETTGFVLFSGHGMHLAGMSTPDAAFLPTDANPDIPATLIRSTELRMLLASVSSSRMVVFLDTCYAAAILRFKGLTRHDLPDLAETLAQGSGRVVVASSQPTAGSFAPAQRGMSVFSGQLLAALAGGAAVRNDGVVRVLDVFHAVSEAMAHDDLDQTPILKAYDLDLNFAIALYHGGAAFSTGGHARRIEEIRAQIITDPIGGAQALSEFLATLPTGTQWRHDVDSYRQELERIQKSENLFLALSDDDKVRRSRAIYMLFKICSDIEQANP
jgi:hypothetical protein